MRGWRRILTIVLIPVVAYGIFVAARTLLIVPENSNDIREVCLSSNQLREDLESLFAPAIKQNPTGTIAPEFKAPYERLVRQADCDKENP